MTNYLRALVQKYSRQGVLVDTNILLLHFVGGFDITLVEKFKRTRAFAQEDFLTLKAFLRPFSKVLTTPNILTEVSNFSLQLPVKEATRRHYLIQFAKGIRFLEERYVASGDVTANVMFPRLGLTDAAIIELVAATRALVLTDDSALYQYLESKGLNAVNFNHIRTMAWGT